MKCTPKIHNHMYLSLHYVNMSSSLYVCVWLTLLTQSSSESIRTNTIKWVQVSGRRTNTAVQTRVLPTERKKPWTEEEINTAKLAYHHDWRADSSCTSQTLTESLSERKSLYYYHKQMQSPITERPYVKVCVNTVQKHFCPFKPTEYILGQVYYIHLIIKLKNSEVS